MFEAFCFSATLGQDSWTPSPTSQSSDPASSFFFSALNSSPAQLLPKIFLLRAGDRTLDSFFLPPLFPALGHLAIYGVLLVFLLPPPHHIFTDSLFFLLARP
jgi:hypothetical protein